MLISYNWLKQFIPDLTESPDEIAEVLSLSLAEVEEVREVGDDHVLEIENKALSHRPDLFSQLDMAREVAAALNKDMKHPMFHVAQPSLREGGKYQIELSIVDETLCPRYMAVVIDNLKIGESPDWMQKRLRSLGQKPINNIVDITNYVMFELGQPVHAFDINKLIGNRQQAIVGVRPAKQGEILTTLDETERELNGGELLITNQATRSRDHQTTSLPIALAGIMGGAETQVNNKTTTILLESANFNMYRVRETSKNLGLRTEASLRFEKGLDPNLAGEGLHRCVELFAEIAGGEAASKVADFYPTPVEPIKIEINLDTTREFLGLNLKDKEILNYWQRFGLHGTHMSNKSYKITVPTFRRDLTIPEDLYEEAARLHGYNNFKPTLPVRPIAPPLENKEWQFANRIRDVLVGLGLDEVLTYSFVDAAAALSKTSNVRPEKPARPAGELDVAARPPQPLQLQNPIAPEMSHLRTSLLPSLGEKVVENAKRFDEFGIFEIGKVTKVRAENTEFRIQNLELEDRGKLIENQKDSERPKLPNEPKMLAAAYYAKDKDKKTVYLHTKGVLETLLITLLNINPLALNTQLKTLNPKGLESLSGAAYGFEVELATLQKLSQPKRFTDIPAHMPTYQDLSFIVDEDVAVGEILKIIHDVPATTRPPLQNIELLDVYQSDQLHAQHQKSITLRLEFLDPAGPLSDREVTPYREEIEQKLKEEFSANIR